MLKRIPCWRWWRLRKVNRLRLEHAFQRLHADSILYGMKSTFIVKNASERIIYAGENVCYDPKKGGVVPLRPAWNLEDEENFKVKVKGENA